MTDDAAPAPIVAGLAWLDASRRPEVLAGPALGAALGAHVVGRRAELLIAIANDVPPAALRLLHALDPIGRLVQRRPGPSLRWSAAAILAETRRWRLDGDPRVWFASADPALVRGRTVVLANGHPAAHADLLERGAPAFAGIDVDGSWAASQGPAIARCVERAQLVTIGETDFVRLPATLRAQLQLGDRALVRKDGARGGRITVAGDELVVPPPPLAAPVVTDVGAGDVLLGVMTTVLAAESRPLSVATVAAAYRRAWAILARLLTSPSFADFASAVLEVPDER